MYHNLINEHFYMKNKDINRNVESDEQLSLNQEINDIFSNEIHKSIESVNNNININNLYPDIESKKEVPLIPCQQDIQHEIN